ncbi:MAG: lipopolysaccharide biosynthesis protein [Candidatus Altiarchaeota archaeon]
MDESLLRKKVVKGSMWVFALRVLQVLFNTARLVVLARIIAPNDFGLMGVALLTMTALETFTETGFQTALIQKSANIRRYLNTAWTVSVIRGLILFTTLFFTAPYFAGFFNVPEGKTIIQAVGVAVLFKSLINVGVIYFQKDLDFRREFTYQFAGTAADFTIAVSSAIVFRNVWALALGYVAGNLTRCIVSYLVHPYRPSFNLNLRRARGLFGFGKWVLGSSVLIFLITQGDNIVVGKLIGATALGLYQMAYLISNTPATEVTNVISQVTFPTYSKLQHRLSKLRQAYLKALGATAFVSFLMAGLIFILAPEFTRTFLGQEWMPMVPAIKILCLYGAVRSLNATVGPVLYSIGRPEVQTMLSGVQLAAMALTIYPLTMRFGIIGVSFSVLFAGGLSLVLIVRELRSTIKVEYRDFLRVISAPILGVIVMFTAANLANAILPFSVIVKFLAVASSSAISYLAALYLCRRELFDEFRKILGGLR